MGSLFNNNASLKAQSGGKKRGSRMDSNKSVGGVDFLYVWWAVGVHSNYFHHSRKKTSRWEPTPT